MKKIFFTFWINIFCFTWFSLAQETHIFNISKVKNYPLIQLKVQNRDPKIIIKKAFSIKEHDNILDFEIDSVKIIQPKVRSQNILILVENLNHDDRLLFYKKALINGLKSINSPHKINIGVFDRVRNNGAKSVFLLLDSFTNNKTKIINAISEIQPKNDIFSNNKSSDLYLAIYEGIDLIKSKEGLQTILLLSTAYNNRWSSHTSSESSKAFAKKYQIPIYSLQFRKQGFEHHKLTDLVNETYGNELITNDNQKASNFISKTVLDLNNNLGNEYFIHYNSVYKQNGETHNSEIKVNKEVYNYTIKTKNIVQWYYYGLGLLALIVLFFLGKHYVKKDNLKSKEKLVLLDQQVKKEQEINKTIQQNLEEQKAVINQFKTEEEAKTHNDILFKKEAAIFIQMKAYGSLPIIQYTIDNENISFIIKKSTISIGRAPTNDIVLSDKQVSREHAKIIFEKGYYIIDLQSTTGVLVNGNRVDKIKLFHGNIIYLGNTQLTIIL
jgi:hypothetical protein